MMNLPPPLLVLCTAALMASSALAQEGTPQPGRALVLGKCFQCHNDAMFRDQRQDRRSWEATIYRMVGRGGLWTPQEIRLMADYLGTELGSNARPTVPSSAAPATPSAAPAPSATPSR
jgi:mono/diheme cytochrome c family protein